MILIGQFDSPFVRRVGVAMHLYGLAFEHRPWSSFGDADRLATHNPLRRVPTLVLDDDSVLVESAAILDYLDDLVGPERAMMPRSGPARRDVLQGCVLATGLADKAVALVYERVLHAEPSEAWNERCARQIVDTLGLLNERRHASPQEFWFGPTVSHADIALACALRFLSDAHPSLMALESYPALAAHSARCEALEPFRVVQQAFVAPR